MAASCEHSEADTDEHTARGLTLDAAQSARSAGSSKSVLAAPAQVKKLLDSRNEREVLDGLRRVINVCARLC